MALIAINYLISPALQSGRGDPGGDVMLSQFTCEFWTKCVVSSLYISVYVYNEYDKTYSVESIWSLSYAPINCFPHYPPLGLHRGKAGGFSSVLNGRRAPRVGNLTLEVVKSPHNPL